MSRYSSIPLLPCSTIQAAKHGKPEAINAVLRYYDSYISALCRKGSYNSNGQYEAVIDPYMKRRLEIKLITAIVTMKY